MDVTGTRRLYECQGKDLYRTKNDAIVHGLAPILDSYRAGFDLMALFEDCFEVCLSCEGFHWIQQLTSSDDVWQWRTFNALLNRHELER